MSALSNDEGGSIEGEDRLDQTSEFHERDHVSGFKPRWQRTRSKTAGGLRLLANRLDAPMGEVGDSRLRAVMAPGETCYAPDYEQLFAVSIRGVDPEVLEGTQWTYQEGQLRAIAKPNDVRSPVDGDRSNGNYSGTDEPTDS